METQRYCLNYLNDVDFISHLKGSIRGVHFLEKFPLFISYFPQCNEGNVVNTKINEFSICKRLRGFI